MLAIVGLAAYGGVGLLMVVYVVGMWGWCCIGEKERSGREE